MCGGLSFRAGKGAFAQISERVSGGFATVKGKVCRKVGGQSYLFVGFKRKPNTTGRGRKIERKKTQEDNKKGELRKQISVRDWESDSGRPLLVYRLEEWIVCWRTWVIPNTEYSIGT